MPRLTLTPDEAAAIEPILERYRANKREVSAYNQALKDAHERLHEHALNDSVTLVMITEILDALRKEFP